MQIAQVEKQVVTDDEADGELGAGETGAQVAIALAVTPATWGEQQGALAQTGHEQGVVIGIFGHREMDAGERPAAQAQQARGLDSSLTAAATPGPDAGVEVLDEPDGESSHVRERSCYRGGGS